MSMIDSIRRQITPIHPEGYIFCRGLCPCHTCSWLVRWVSRLDRRHRHCLVRLFFSRPGPFHAARRNSCGLTRRWHRLLNWLFRAAAGAWPRRRTDAADFRVHVGLRLPCEPCPRRRAGDQDCLQARSFSQRGPRQGKRKQRAQWPCHRGRRRPLWVVQIAGFVARRIVCFVRQGEAVGAGDRFGLIRFGSRVDVYMPGAAQPLVTIGSKAIAGETVLAELRSNGSRRSFKSG